MPSSVRGDVIWHNGAWSEGSPAFGEDGTLAPLAATPCSPNASATTALLPGMINAHSHAFQRAMRGRTQTAGPANDTFWTWREQMYTVASRISPEDLLVIARQLYVEFLLSGVTAVGEFHYVHHQPGGAPYASPHAMSEALIEAARQTGIRLCLLPTAYLQGGFDAPLSEEQRRFADGSIDDAIRRFQDLEQSTDGSPTVTFGVAAHSLRAVPSEQTSRLKKAFPDRPFHIHASEQRQEVTACIEQLGGSPIEILDRAGALDASTTVVHATHLRKGDVDLLGGTQTNVCVCPSTEADLGDGLADVSAMREASINLCLGTDDHTLSSILEEARRLEMHERLRTEQRNCLSDGPGSSSARPCWHAASEGGARALGLPAGRIESGRWADLVRVHTDAPELCGSTPANLLENIVFSAGSRAIQDVWVGGRQVVQEGHHALQETSAVEFRALMRKFDG